jgi:hypothetical protein
MLATSLVFGSFLTILFLMMGLFYDQDGNVIPDEVLAVSFNPDYFDDKECDDEEED